MADGNSSQKSYLYGRVLESSSTYAYIKGRTEIISWLWGYTKGGITGLGEKAAFLYGAIGSNSSKSAYLEGIGQLKSYVHAYIPEAIYRSSLSAMLEGEIMSVAYIELKTSDGGVTLSKKFRVIAPNYDDGTLEKAESTDRTIGGGINHNVGAIYTNWNPVIRVRHTEPETGYGTLEDLRTFYSYNNPNGTPSNVIHFFDHHQVEHEVYITGTFQKAMMGIAVEGNQAWFTVKLKFIKAN